VLIAAALPAEAAVRTCHAPVNSGLASDAVEAKARGKAIAAWTERARAAGARNPSWRIASKRILRCARVANGLFDCVALAEPCTISQTAPPLPKRGKVKDKPIAT
jgi:hypothetical protein